MNHFRFLLFLFVLILSISSISLSQTFSFSASYRTYRSGEWNADSTWQILNEDHDWELASTPPSSADSIIVQAGHTITISSDLSIRRSLVKGELVVGSGATLTISSGGGIPDVYVSSTGILRIKGVMTVSGSLTLSSGSTVIYDGTAAQSVRSLDFANLQIDNPAGVDLLSHLMVEGNLTLTSGDVRTGPNVLTLGSRAHVFETDSHFVLGKLHTSRQCTTGTNETFGGMGIELKARSLAVTRNDLPPAVTSKVTGYFTVSVTRTTGSALAATGTTLVKRRFDLSTGGSGLDANLVFQCRTAELNGVGESNIQLYESTDGGSNWISRGGTVNTGAHTITITGVNSLNSWTAGRASGAPTLNSVSPSSAQPGAALTVTLFGTQFADGVSKVSFGDGITVNSATSNVAGTQIAAAITIGPAAAAGSRNVSVVNPSPEGGTITLNGGFSVLSPAPAVSSITPAIVIRGQTTLVTIAGSNFVAGSTSISLGIGAVINSFAVNSTTQIVANISIGVDASTGARNVIITNAPPGGGSATLTGGLAVENPAPSLATVSPNLASRGDVVDVALTGTSFIAGVTAVSFGDGISVNSVSVSSLTAATANVTVGVGAALGPRNVSVTNPAPGGGTSTLSGIFTIGNPVPTLSVISPSVGRRGQTFSLSLTGTGFISGSTSLNLGANVHVNSLVITTGSQMTAGVTVGTDAGPGPRAVLVANVSPGGGTATLVGGLTIENPVPVLTSIAPVSGIRGTTLGATLTGSNFINSLSQVGFGPDIQVNSISVSSSTQIVVSLTIAQGASTDSRDVIVTHASPGGGTATLSGAFSVTNPAPSVVSVAPLSAGRGSVLNITLTGSQFISGVTSVGFGADITTSNLIVKSPTELQTSITINAVAAIGSRTVTITNAAPGGGSASLPNAFSVTTNLATDVQNDPGALAHEYALQEAYPNPFNPSTRIAYSLPEDSRIRLEVHNMLGNVVAELAIGERPKGYYEMQWHADNLPSGVYLIRMQAESLESTKRFIASRKVVLVK